MTKQTCKMMITRLRSLDMGEREVILEKVPTVELIELATELVGEPKSKTPKPALQHRVLEALAKLDVDDPRPVREGPPEDLDGGPQPTDIDDMPIETEPVPAKKGKADKESKKVEVKAAKDAKKVAKDAKKAAAKAAKDAEKAAAKVEKDAKKAEAKDAEKKVLIKVVERDPRLPPPGALIEKKGRDGKVRSSCNSTDTNEVVYKGEVYKTISGAALAAAKDLGLEVKTLNGFAWWGLIKNEGGGRTVSLEKKAERVNVLLDKLEKVAMGFDSVTDGLVMSFITAMKASLEEGKEVVE